MPLISPVTSLVFIDDAVVDYQSLIDGLAPGTEAIVLDPTQDGIEQITATLANRSDIQSVHIVSHGSSGSLQLGSTTLNGESLDRYQAQLQGWRSALTDDADILLYGCDVAGDDSGEAFVRSLSQITGADVAASNDLTGSAKLGGDWDLEVQMGEIESAAAFHVNAMQSYQAVLPAFLDENFDAVTPGALPTGWTVFKTGAVANWTSVNTSSSTVTNSAFTVDAGSNSTNYLISPSLTLVAASQLTFQHRYGTDGSYDGGVLEVSINGGAFTDILTAGGSFVQGGYTGSLNGLENSPFGTRQAWSGSLPNFSPVVVNLPAAAVGQSIRLRWGFGAGDTVGGTGWFIDNVEINTTTLPIIRLNTPDAAAAETGSDIGVYRITRTNTSAALDVKLNINASSTASASDYTFSVSAGTFSVVGSTVTVTLPAGVGTVNLTLTPVNDALTEPSETLKLDLSPDAAYTINTTNNTGTVTIAPSIGNTAPTLSDTTVTLAAVNEDAGLPIGAVGTLVSAIVSLGGNVTDPDVGATTGIAITTVDTTNGTWFYTTNNGGVWTALGTVSNTSARLLAADTNTRLYFQPNANYNGSIATAITFRAWDTTSGTNGGTADTSTNGGGTAFSTAIDTASIAINPINDAPLLTSNATLTAIDEDTIAPAGATIATLFSTQFSDPDAGSSLSGVAVVGNTAPSTDGAWEYSTDAGANWNAIATVADGATALALSAATLVRFLPVANYSGIPTSLTIRALDDTYAGGFTNGVTRVTVDTTTNGGATAIAAAVNTVNTSITSVNDAPVLTGGVTLTAIDEDILDAANTGTKVSDLINGLITDVDGDPKAIAITGIDNTKGAWQYSTNGGTTWTPIATTSDSNATLLGATSFYSANLGTAPASQTWLGYTAVTIPAAGAPTLANGTEVTGANGALVTTIADQKIYAGYSNYTTSGTLVNAASPTLNATTGYSVSFDLQVLADSNTNPNRAGFSILLVSQDTTKAIELAFQRLSPTTGNIFAQNNSFIAAESASFNTNQKTDYRVEVLGTTYKLFANDTEILTGSLRDYTAFTPPANFPFDPYEKPSLIFLGDDTTSAQGTFNLSQVVVQTDNRVRFVPTANENGNSTINFRAWDTTNGEASGAIANASVNGGMTAYSTVTGTVSIAVNAINDAPVGVPTIAGTTTEDQTLTADVTGITDDDGLGTLSYQWQSSTNGTTWTNITGATATTFVLGDEHVGQQVRVNVSYTDGQGTPESINSAATAAIANVNDIPTRLPTIAGTTTEDQTLTADATAIADIDGLGTFSYQWQSSPDGTIWTNITGATATTFVLGDDQVGQQVRVNVSYTDGEGTPESINSAATTAIANVNDVPTGVPTITGTTTEDQTLTVDTSAIADNDGLGTFSYQWQLSPDGTTWTNITGATATSFVLGDDQVGEQVRVNVSYTDAESTLESINSAATAAIANVNDAPTGFPTITGTATEDQTLTVNATAIADIDGLGTFSYQWQSSSDGTTWTNITGATAITFVLGDNEVGQQVRVNVSYTDGEGTAELISSNATTPIANINDLPTGLPTITGTATEDQTLTADASGIADIDGLDTFSYQWQASPDGTTWTNITGATATTFVLGDNEVGQQVRVNVSYTDGEGTPESINSAATTAIANINDVPTGLPTIAGTTIEDQTLTADASGIADIDGLGTFSYQWQSSPDGTTWTNITGATATTFVLGDNQVGQQVRVNVSYTDGEGTLESISSTATTAIANVNDIPTVATAIVDQSATEDTLFTFAIPANSFTDIDPGDTLIYTATQADNTPLPLWLTFNATNQTFSGTPTNPDVGSLSIKVTAKDIANATAEDIFNLTVNNFNDAPTLDNAIADQLATEDTLFTFAVPPNTFSDADTGDILTYTATQADDTPLPSWLTFNATNQTFNGTPLNAEVGSLNVKVKVTDQGLLTAEDIFKVDVANTNDAPTVTNAIADQTTNEDAPFTFTLPANTFTDVDAGDTLTYTATLASSSPLPTWLTFNPTTRAFNGTPRNANVGNLNLKVKATDGTGAIAEDSFTVKVVNINQPPVISTPITPTPQQITATEPFTLKIPVGAFTDSDPGDTLTFSATLESGAPFPSGSDLMPKRECSAAFPISPQLVICH